MGIKKYNPTSPGIRFKTVLTFEEITNNYYLQSYYGGAGFTPIFYINWLDRMLNADFKAIGQRHIYLISRIAQNKYADGKR
jgi:hypothetical protein